MTGEASRSLQWLNMLAVSWGVTAILIDSKALAEPFFWMGMAAFLGWLSVWIEPMINEYRNQEVD